MSYSMSNEGAARGILAVHKELWVPRNSWVSVCVKELVHQQGHDAAASGCLHVQQGAVGGQMVRFCVERKMT